MDFKLEDYDISTIEIKRGEHYYKNDTDCRWYDVSLNIQNKYFKYNETRECLLEEELWEIYNTINKCLDNKLSENKHLTFIEHDLELEFSKSNDENQIHLLEFQIYIHLEGIIGCDYYSFTLGEEEMVELRDYIKKVLKNRNNVYTENEKLYTYVSVIYDDDFIAKTLNEPTFYYLTDLEDIDIDDKVLVNRSGKNVVAIVTDVEEFNEEDAPYPVEKTKSIIKILESAHPQLDIKCPNCGNKLIPIVYGLPTDFRRAEQGKEYLGGCMMEEGAPKYHCNNCRRGYTEDLQSYIDQPNNWEEI